MKKHFVLFFLAVMLLITFVFTELFASSFQRRRNDEKKGDLIYGERWDQMDSDLDGSLDGRVSERDRNLRFQRNPNNQNNRNNQNNNNRNQRQNG